MKYVVINQYGIRLQYEDKHPRNDGYVYVPRYATGEESGKLCDRFIKQHDSAGTCAIVEIEE